MIVLLCLIYLDMHFFLNSIVRLV